MVWFNENTYKYNHSCLNIVVSNIKLWLSYSILCLGKRKKSEYLAKNKHSKKNFWKTVKGHTVRIGKRHKSWRIHIWIPLERELTHNIIESYYLIFKYIPYCKYSKGFRVKIYNEKKTKQNPKKDPKASSYCLNWSIFHIAENLFYHSLTLFFKLAIFQLLFAWHISVL